MFDAVICHAQETARLAVRMLTARAAGMVLQNISQVDTFRYASGAFALIQMCCQGAATIRDITSISLSTCYHGTALTMCVLVLPAGHSGSRTTLPTTRLLKATRSSHN
jgi:hypothetical protein